MKHFIDDVVDSRSVGLYACSIILQIIHDYTLDDITAIMATAAAFTTVSYNVIKTYKELKKNEKDNK